eukprot:1386223-Amorphochlora_amoeboformis.AAC.1
MAAYIFDTVLIVCTYSHLLFRLLWAHSGEYRSPVRASKDGTSRRKREKDGEVSGKGRCQGREVSRKVRCRERGGVGKGEVSEKGRGVGKEEWCRERGEVGK